jgi:hypothetical protein
MTIPVSIKPISSGNLRRRQAKATGTETRKIISKSPKSGGVCILFKVSPKKKFFQAYINLQIKRNADILSTFRESKPANSILIR